LVVDGDHRGCPFKRGGDAPGTGTPPKSPGRGPVGISEVASPVRWDRRSPASAGRWALAAAPMTVLAARRGPPPSGGQPVSAASMRCPNWPSSRSSRSAWLVSSQRPVQQHHICQLPKEFVAAPDLSTQWRLAGEIERLLFEENLIICAYFYDTLFALRHAEGHHWCRPGADRAAVAVERREDLTGSAAVSSPERAAAPRTCWSRPPSALRSRSTVPSIGGNTDRIKESTSWSGCAGLRPVTNSAWLETSARIARTPSRHSAARRSRR